jgi:uncharacterized protein (TIGR02246 family)
MHLTCTIASFSLFGFLSLSPTRVCKAQETPETSVVKHTVAAFATDWNRHDMVAFGMLFTPGADFVNVAGSWWRGRTTIQHNHAYSHGTIAKNDTAGFDSNPVHWGIFKHSTMSFDSIAVRFIEADVAVARVRWRLMGDSRIASSRTGMLFFVLVRGKQDWQITAAQNTEVNRMVH